MSLMDTSQIKMLEHYLGLASRRQTVIASNIANIDTPGYRTRDIQFSDELKNALERDSSEVSAPTYEVPGLIERPDGNNVSLERESLLLGQTQLQFRIGVELLRSQFHNLLNAINEGR